MNSEFLDSRELEIDLAFSGFLDQDSLGLDNLAENFWLNDSEFWSSQLTIWIQNIRQDQDLNCPKVVKDAELLSLGLQFTDDEFIKELNTKWLQKQEKTDVLSFPALDGNMFLSGSYPIELGDIVVSVPTAQNQAREHQHCLEMEVRWLVSHGLLHLLGWDHPDTKQLNRMLGLQEQLLQIGGNLSSVRT
tara:strand:- start:1205 stop:1774 length:570 start_codon:yes stop_codon:yes gene_type:complete